jgi:hypothetical protein
MTHQKKLEDMGFSINNWEDEGVKFREAVLKFNDFAIECSIDIQNESIEIVSLIINQDDWGYLRGCKTPEDILTLKKLITGE